MAGAAAHATGSLTAPIQFVFNGFEAGAKAGASFDLACPPDRILTLATARGLVKFGVYTVDGYHGAYLSSVTLTPACSNEPGASPTLMLDYVIDGTTVRLIEGPAQNKDSLTLTVKGNGPDTSPWRRIDVDGSTYAVFTLPQQTKFGQNADLSDAIWQKGRTMFSLSSTESIACPLKPDCYYNPGMTMATFTHFVTHLTRD
ncbi:MAG: hypothetical protein E6I16_05550 [Chloroflexi bacterium]|nr:MAG: hypothetical protein E6I16_05550 [Chloroflexota bacterium]